MLSPSQISNTSPQAPDSIAPPLPSSVRQDATARRDGFAKSKAPDHQPHILLIGDEPTLQYSRRKILESHGYSVGSAHSDLAVEELFLRNIELVLLCHTIPENILTHIAKAFARLAPKVPVLLILPIGNSLLYEGIPSSVEAQPAALLGAVSARLGHH